jgi:hypothetical protein
LSSLNDLTNSVLFSLLEPGANFGGAPQIPQGATYSQAVITKAINDGIKAYIAMSGFPPTITERVYQFTITAGLDYVLPADLVALRRVEYDAGNTGNPIPLARLSFDQFDVQTGDNASLQAAGTPLTYREPFAGSIRLNPQPNAANVAADDQIYLYGSSYGITLANGADIPNIPVEHHEALECYALAKLTPRKFDDAQGGVWFKKFLSWVELAKRRYWDVNQDADFQIQDAEMSGQNTLYDD